MRPAPHNMRYRPLGKSGTALSSLALNIGPGAIRLGRNHTYRLIMAALENGINTYHFDVSHPDILRAAADAFSDIDRKILFLSVNAHNDLSQDPQADYALRPLRERLRSIVQDYGLGYIDLLMFHAHGFNKIPDSTWIFLEGLKNARLLRYLGASANTDHIKDVVEHGRFGILRTVFDLDTNWDKRHLLDHAIARGLNILGHDYFPTAYQKSSDTVPKAARRGWFGGKAADPLAGSGTYAFLHQTPSWSAEELCLAYTLSQPCLTSVLVSPETPERLNALAEISERNMPPSVPAQIEMARFSAQGDKRA
ncbi:MAG: aldo/keto reductase [Asticcacaulis sp.]